MVCVWCSVDLWGMKRRSSGGKHEQSWGGGGLCVCGGGSSFKSRKRRNKNRMKWVGMTGWVWRHETPRIVCNDWRSERERNSSEGTLNISYYRFFWNILDCIQHLYDSLLRRHYVSFQPPIFSFFKISFVPANNFLQFFSRKCCLLFI